MTYESKLPIQIRTTNSSKPVLVPQYFLSVHGTNPGAAYPFRAESYQPGRAPNLQTALAWAALR